jgi:hypothetical protein
MEVGQTVDVEVVIRNLLNVNYSNVQWEIGKNEYGKTGLETVNNDGNKILRLKALSEGVSIVRAEFNKTTPVECTIYVEKQKALNIEKNHIAILPNEIIEIKYSVLPAEPESEVKLWMDFEEYLDIIDINGNVLQSDVYKNRIISGGMIRIRGKKKEGFTKIKLTNFGIEKMITVNTNYRYAFYMPEQQVIRGKPGSIVTAKYNIFPEFDPVRYKSGGGNSQNWIVNPANLAIDRNQQIIRMTLGNCGYTKMIFESDYNSAIGLNLEIPVFVYYEKINLSWIGRNNNAADKSWMDPARNVIYIADGEKFRVDYERINYPLNMSARGYTGSNVLFTPGSGGTEYMQARFKNESRPVVIVRVNDYIELSDNTPENYRSMTKADSLVDVQYAGTLEVKYAYYTGRETPDNFVKQFMVYREVWARK